MNIKKHSTEAGYICERTNPFVPGTKVVVYVSGAQGLDTGTYKYAIVCDAHHSIGCASNVPNARASMKRPDNFCDGCREARP